MKIDFLADTNILINLLEGNPKLASYSDKLLIVSFVTEIEFLGMPKITPIQLKTCKGLLEECIVIPYSDETKEIVISLRQKIKVTLSDAFIAATAIQYDLPILTFDKGFAKIPGIDLSLL